MKMMQCKSIAVCIVVAILGVISTAVGLLLEFAPDKTMVRLFRFSWNNDDDYCTGEDCVQCDYFRSAAFYLLVAASVSVIFAQIIISISTDCGCCSGRNSSSSSQILSIFAFVFSWLSCIAAIIVYLIGGAKQYGVQFPESGRVSSLRSLWVDNTNCYKVKPGLFGAAAAFCFGAASLGIINYLISISKNNRTEISSTTTEFQNHGNSPDHMDRPTDIAIALPDVPATPVRRFVTAERYQLPTEPRRIPVMVQA
ncbi:uncharacterized protein LOC141648122 [Silene latifolia]|uniref:uncharacterized protein LOC141648122 n=1 Tax=Silene latifolia TaxID=37657 RepID=UPI003D7815B3